jgi:hypothetical protein
VTIGLVFFSLCSVLKSRTKQSYCKSLTATFTVFICVTMDTDKLNNKNKIYTYSRSQMKIVLMHRKINHWTGYSPLADSCAAITSFSQNFLLTVYSKSYCHLMYVCMNRTKYTHTFIRLPMMMAHGPNR